MQHQRRIAPPNQRYWKEELERNQSLQQLNQPDTPEQDDSSSVETTQLIPSTSNRLPLQQDRATLSNKVRSQQVARSQFYIRNFIVFVLKPKVRKKHLN